MLCDRNGGHSIRNRVMDPEHHPTLSRSRRWHWGGGRSSSGTPISGDLVPFDGADRSRGWIPEQSSDR